MRRVRWSLRQILLANWALYSRLALALERVPYTDGLTEGQGYNTYLQMGCRHGVVAIQRDQDPATTPNVDVTYKAERVTDYKKLVESVGGSAGATIYQMDKAGASINSSFLDRTEFESSSLTYVVRVDVRQQPSVETRYNFTWINSPDAREVYCDRFISGFVQGGALFARVSITAKDTARHEEIEASAKTVAAMYGVNLAVTSSMERSLDFLRQHSSIEIALHTVGAPPMQWEPAEGNNESTRKRDNIDDSDKYELVRLKRVADDFASNAAKHGWKRFALLSPYKDVPGFKNQFTPHDYSRAKDESWSVFLDFSKYHAIQKAIRQINQEHYKGGKQTRDALDKSSNSILDAFRRWTEQVSEDPANVDHPAPYNNPEEFRAKVLLSVESRLYRGQRVLMSNGHETDIIDDIQHKNKKTDLFTIAGFAFGDVPGTVELIFAKKYNEDKYTCLLDKAITRGYRSVSRLWVFPTSVPGVTNQTVDVLARPAEGGFQLELEDNSRPDRLLFSFYVIGF